jgi:hypothetical protein
VRFLEIAIPVFPCLRIADIRLRRYPRVDPAVLTEVAAYTDERIREFEGAARMSEDELRAARLAWRVTPRPT